MTKYTRLTSPSAIIDYIKSLEEKIQAQATKGSGDITMVDPETGVETVLGTLPDGSVGLEQFIGDTEPPPVATAPYVSAQPGNFVVTWDGLFVAGADKPRDFVHVNVIGHKMDVDGVTTLLNIPVGVIRTVTESVLVTLDVAAGGESWQFSLESEDYSGNKAVESARTASVMMIDSISSTDQAWLDLNTEVAGKGRTFTQSVAPPVEERLPQNLWIDTSAGPGLYVTRYWDGTAGQWLSLKDKDAKAAQDTADTKGVTIYSSTTPAASAQLPQNLWVDTTGGINIQKRWVQGSGWVVVSDSRISSNASAVTAADAKAQTALDSANGKNKVHFSTSPATGTTDPTDGNRPFIEGDVWFQRNSVSPYNIIGQWEFTGGAFQPRKVDGQVLANLDAGTITVGFLSGQNLAATAIDGKTITGALIQTTNTPVSGASARGIKLTPTELMGFDGAGAKTFSLTAAGALTLKGTIQSGSSIQGASLAAGGGGIETSTSANTGVKLQNSGIKAYDGTNLTFSVDAATGIVDAPGIRTNSLSGDKVIAKSLTADKLVITSTDNLIMEADFSNLGKSWVLSANNTINATAGRGGLAAMRITGTTSPVTSLNMNSTALNISNKIAIDAGARFRGSMWVRSSAAAASGVYKIVGRFYTTATAFTDIVIASNPAMLANTWTNVDGIVPATIPVGTIAAEFYLSMQNAAAGTTTDIDFASVTRASDGKLIVDGAIDGKTITGAIIRTAAAGARIVLDQNSLNAWNTAGDNYFNMSDADGVNISSRGKAGYDIARTNWCTNPSMEFDISGWTSSQTIVRDGTQFYNTSPSANWSLKATHTATADRIVSRKQDATAKPGDWRFSAYVRHNSASNKTVTAKLYWTDASNVPVAGGTFTGTAVTVPPNTWTRVVSPVTTSGKPSTASFIRMDVVGTAFTSTETMWVDAVMLEFGSYATFPALGTYFDGSTAAAPNTAYVWRGEPDLSESDERVDRDVKIKSGGNNVLEPTTLSSKLAPGIGFIPPTPRLQTAGLFSDGYTTSLIAAGNDPQLTRIDVGAADSYGTNIDFNTYSYGVTRVTARGGVTIDGQAGGVFISGTTSFSGTVNGVNMESTTNTPVPLSNSWANFGAGYTGLNAKEIAPGVILLEGMIKPGTKTDGITVGVIPAEFRPNRIHNLTVNVRTSNAAPNLNQPALLQVNSNGNIALFSDYMSTTVYAMINVIYFIYVP